MKNQQKEKMHRRSGQTTAINPDMPRTGREAYRPPSAMTEVQLGHVKTSIYIYTYVRAMPGPHSRPDVVAPLHSNEKINKGIRE